MWSTCPPVHSHRQIPVLTSVPVCQSSLPTLVPIYQSSLSPSVLVVFLSDGLRSICSKSEILQTSQYACARRWKISMLCNAVSLELTIACMPTATRISWTNPFYSCLLDSKILHHTYYTKPCTIITWRKTRIEMTRSISPISTPFILWPRGYMEIRLNESLARVVNPPIVFACTWNITSCWPLETASINKQAHGSAFAYCGMRTCLA